MEESLKARRAQLLVDPELQGTIIKRVIVYWLCALASLATSLVISRIIAGARLDLELLVTIGKDLFPALVISLLPLPLVIRDTLRATHRFAGPMLRIRRGLAELAREGKSPAIVAREGDAWPNCIADFNDLAKQLENVTIVEEGNP
jgi:hypothetical protein